MPGIAVELHGFEELMRTLAKIEVRVANAIYRKALRAGSSVVLKEMKARVPRSDNGGFLKKSLGRRFKTYRYRATSVAMVGPRRKMDNRPTKYAHLTEFGTGPRYTKEGHFRGAVPANPWMRLSFEASKEPAQKQMMDKMAEELRKVGPHG